jgi:hypothetical protein
MHFFRAENLQFVVEVDDREGLNEIGCLTVGLIMDDSRKVSGMVNFNGEYKSSISYGDKLLLENKLQVFVIEQLL